MYLGVFRQSFVVRVQNMRSALNNVDRDLISDNARERIEQVLIQQVVQLGSELNTSGTTTTDHEGKQTSALLVGRSRKTGQLHVLQHLVLDPASIINSFQEVTVLETLDSMWVCNTSWKTIKNLRHETFRGMNIPTPTTSLSYGR